MDADLGSDEVRPPGGFWNLQAEGVVVDGVVVVDDTIFLHRKSFTPLRRPCFDEGRCSVDCWNHEMAIEFGQKRLGDEPICRVDSGDAGQTQFLGQATLQRLKHALAASPRLGRISRNMLNPELA